MAVLLYSMVVAYKVQLNSMSVIECTLAYYKMCLH